MALIIGDLPGPEMWGTSAGYYWWQSIKSFGAEMFSGIYHCPESNYTKNEALSWNAPGYPAIAFIGALWGRAPLPSDYEVAFHGNSYGMNNQCTFGNLGYNTSTKGNYCRVGDATNRFNQPENRICGPSAALHEARNGVSHSVASCALQLGHSCGFQGTKWVTRKDS